MTKKGFSFPEVIAAIAILSIVGIAVANILSSMILVDRNKAASNSLAIDYDNIYDMLRSTTYDELVSHEMQKYGDVYFTTKVKETVGGADESFRKNIVVDIYDKDKKFLTSMDVTKVRLKGYALETLSSSLLGDNYMTLWLSTNDKTTGTYYISRTADGSWGARYSINAFMDTHNKYYYLHVKITNKEGPCETCYGLMGSVTLPASSKYRFTYANKGLTVSATTPSHWRASNTSFSTIGYEPTAPVAVYCGAWGDGLWSSGACHRDAYFTTQLERVAEDANEF